MVLDEHRDSHINRQEWKKKVVEKMDYMENYEKRIGYRYESNGEVIHKTL